MRSKSDYYKYRVSKYLTGINLPCNTIYNKKEYVKDIAYIKKLDSKKFLKKKEIDMLLYLFQKYQNKKPINHLKRELIFIQSNITSIISKKRDYQLYVIQKYKRKKVSENIFIGMNVKKIEIYKRLNLLSKKKPLYINVIDKGLLRKIFLEEKSFRDFSGILYRSNSFDYCYKLFKEFKEDDLNIVQCKHLLERIAMKKKSYEEAFEFYKNQIINLIENKKQLKDEALYGVDKIEINFLLHYYKINFNDDLYYQALEKTLSLKGERTKYQELEFLQNIIFHKKKRAEIQRLLKASRYETIKTNKDDRTFYISQDLNQKRKL